MSKVCFVISPMGPTGSSAREGADYVLATDIKPDCEEAAYDALRNPDCEEAGYDALRAEGVGLGHDILTGSNTALQNAPIAVAYMGCPSQPASRDRASRWNANVIIEIGYRLASRLPGYLPRLPMSTSQDLVRRGPLGVRGPGADPQTKGTKNHEAHRAEN